MEFFLAKLFQLFPMAFFNLGFAFLSFLLHKKNLEFFGIEDQRLRLMLSEIIFAVQEIYLQYPDSVVIIGLGLSFISLRYIRYKWAIINTVACLAISNEMAMSLMMRMLATISASVFVYMHIECIRMVSRSREREEIPLPDLMVFLEETGRMQQENN